MRADDETTDLATSDRIDEAVLRAVAPRRVIGAFVYNVGSLIVVVGGVLGFTGYGWGSFLDWRLYAGGLALGTAQSLFHGWLVRRQLRRTSGEALEELRQWDALVRPGWPLRVVGWGVGMAALFTTLAFILLAIFEPAELAGGVFEWLRLTAFGSAIMVPAMFLLRPFAVWQLRKFDPQALEAPPPSPE